jgi:hypothetical protein
MEGRLMALRSRPTLGLVKQDDSPPAPSPTRRPPALESPVKAAAREGKVQLSGYIPIDFKRQLDIHAAREGITIQSIVEEMHDLYASAHGLTRLAGLGE